MTYNVTYTDDSRDQIKNPKLVCYAFNNPSIEINQTVWAMIQKLSHDLKCSILEAKHRRFKFFLLPRAMWLRG